MGKMHSDGVTLIETMVTVTIAAIVLAIGAPALGDLVATNRMYGTVNDLVTSLHLARTEAVKRGGPAIFCASDTWNTAIPACGGASLADGWIVFADIDNNGVVDLPGDVLQTHASVHSSITVTAPTNVIFGSVGTATPGGIDLRVCDTRGNRDTGGGISAGRRVQLSQTGRPRVLSKTSDVIC